ncbi:MAG: hypothetical protein LC121_26975 [Anaerolineae bacterium]|nr:hypothetical protein [Anaerolineae bacterium]
MIDDVERDRETHAGCSPAAVTDAILRGGPRCPADGVMTLMGLARQIADGLELASGSRPRR